MALVRDTGLELSDEQLEAVSGGGNWSCWDIVGCTDICEKYDPEWRHECWRYQRPEGPIPCSLH